MDIPLAEGDNQCVARPGASRKRIAATLHAAYADGLISQDTLVARLDRLLGARIIDPRRLIGDLTLRISGRHLGTRLASLTRLVTQHRAGDLEDVEIPLLALEWGGHDTELLIGRNPDCDVVLPDTAVSRRHARLVLRDGVWSVQDLASTNGTFVNGVRVGRYALRPGDHLQLGTESLQID